MFVLELRFKVGVIHHPRAIQKGCYEDEIIISWIAGLLYHVRAKYTTQHNDSDTGMKRTEHVKGCAPSLAGDSARHGLSNGRVFSGRMVPFTGVC